MSNVSHALAQTDVLLDGTPQDWRDLEMAEYLHFAGLDGHEVALRPRDIVLLVGVALNGQAATNVYVERLTQPITVKGTVAEVMAIMKLGNHELEKKELELMKKAAEARREANEMVNAAVRESGIFSGYRKRSHEKIVHPDGSIEIKMLLEKEEEKKSAAA